jgi:ribonuclease PH
MSKVKKTKRKSRKKFKRADGRKVDELRPLSIETGVIPNADGSAYIEMGRNKIIAAVYGPREMHPKRLSKPNILSVLIPEDHQHPLEEIQK